MCMIIHVEKNATRGPWSGLVGHERELALQGGELLHGAVEAEAGRMAVGPGGSTCLRNRFLKTPLPGSTENVPPAWETKICGEIALLDSTLV